jgi:hypothetical protein
MDTYEQLLAFFITNASSSNQFMNVIKSGPCIPTAAHGFQLISELLDPAENQFYHKLFKPTCFPSAYFCNNKQAMLVLSANGLVNVKTIRNSCLIALIKSIDSNEKRDFSRNLMLFLSELLQIKEQFEAELVEAINQSKWVFAKSKPDDWHLQWFTDTNTEKFFKPCDLYRESVELLVGSARPVFDSSVLANNKTLMIDLKLSQDQTAVIAASIETINVIKCLLNQNNAKFCRFIRAFSETRTQLHITRFYNDFVKYLQDYTTEDKTLNPIELDDRLKNLKTNLNGLSWIYYSEKNKLLPIESFAFNVENQIEPYLLELPSNYLIDHRSKHFFEILGIKDHFSLEFLRVKLKEIKNRFGELPMDETSLLVCKKIVDEMIYVDEFKKDVSTSLAKMVENTTVKKIYLPDVGLIMRDLKDLCYEKSRDISSLINEDNIFIVHESIAYEKFGIKALRKRIFELIAEPFGQKEDLINRTHVYSPKISIFKGKYFIPDI